MIKMDECEIIPSQKVNNKINVRGLLLNDARKYTRNTFYCCCQKRKLENCKGRATTTLQLVNLVADYFIFFLKFYTNDE